MINKKLSRFIALVFALCLMGNALVFPASAASAYETYNYTTDKKETSSPDIYTVDQVIYGAKLPGGTFVEAQDMFVDAKDRVYILDSANSRIIFLNADFSYQGELAELRYKGEAVTISAGAEGIFFHDIRQKIYIADTNNNRIIVCDRDGNVSNIFKKPVSPVLDVEVEYKPSKIIVDNNNNMYVISKNINTGAIMTDPNNEFIGFFGINPVKETAIMKAEKLWKKLIGKSDYSFQPVAVNNLFWAKDHFVYSVSTRNSYLISEVSKLNALGKNVFTSTDFGDISDTVEMTEIFDIAVDDNGFFTILDRHNGKLYCYDNECNLIGAFGGIGNREGLYQIPNAVSYNSKGQLLVLDAEKNTLTVLSKTEYAKKVYAALEYYLDGQYEAAIEPLNEVLKINTNFNLLYTAKGKSDMMLRKYKTAMNNFEFGDNQEEYSKAKQADRNESIKEHFALVATVILLLVFSLVFLDKEILFAKLVFKKLVRGKKR